MEKLAVIFPGIGYHTDKPLLYYGKKLAREQGYTVIELSYGGFPKNLRGDRAKMQEAFSLAWEQAEEQLGRIRFSEYDSLLFLSKSIGTAVAAAYAERHEIKVCHVFYTPVAETFSFMEKPEGIVFHGTSDPWVGTSLVEEKCREKGLPLFITRQANHSLETGDAMIDIQNLEKIMKQTKDYLTEI